MRVLYVDDDRVNSLLFAEACRVAGIGPVDTADDGADALAQAARVLPDVLVIDLHLPDTDGCTLLGRLRDHLPALAGRPAFLCTADDTTALQVRARAAGFAGCWAKPVAVAGLLAALAPAPSPPPG
jgi:CheY-like chemotaxis protein